MCGKIYAALHVQLVEIVITESGVTLGTFALSCVVTCLQTFEAEHVEAFGEDGILWTGVTTGTCEASLVHFDFLYKDFIRRSQKFNLFGSVQFLLESDIFFLDSIALERFLFHTVRFLYHTHFQLL